MSTRSPIPAGRTAHQASFDELGTPLSDVTFCVIDFETTGSSPDDCSITEIGAVKLRAGECLGTMQTLVNPGRAIPPTITVLTGITEAMVVRAPRIETVLGTLVDFIADSVIVAHNARFDMAFLQAALRRDERPELSNAVVDTVPLARRLLRDEVPNCKLGTLARHYRFEHTPSHRALDDALATGDLLHVLLDRARSLGVTGLDDLRSLPRMANHAQAAKLRLTDRLPREPGVYLFREPSGNVLYVGKATNLRSRVRSYFSSDDRRKVGPLLRETGRIDFKRTASPLEAAVLEMRLIHHLEPHYNREGNRWRSSVYVKLTNERFPRLKVVKEPVDDGARYLGPIGSRATALLVVEAIETVVPLRRCAATRPGRRGPCVPAQLGVSMCCCAGEVTPEAYAPVAALAARCLDGDPGVVVDALADRMNDLAAEERFEEAAATRDRMNAFAEAVRRQRLLDRTRDTAVLEIEDAAGHRYELHRGRLVRHWAPEAVGAQAAGDLRLEGVDPGRQIEAVPPDPGASTSGPLARDLADEVLLMARWLDRNAHRVRLRRVEGEMSSPIRPVPSPGRVGRSAAV
ncbi:MAG: DEDD exonuclease domain-containing protein [Acidimicrobiales bacterium]